MSSMTWLLLLYVLYDAGKDSVQEQGVEEKDGTVGPFEKGSGF